MMKNGFLDLIILNRGSCYSAGVKDSIFTFFELYLIVDDLVSYGVAFIEESIFVFDCREVLATA